MLHQKHESKANKRDEDVNERKCWKVHQTFDMRSLFINTNDK